MDPRPRTRQRHTAGPASLEQLKRLIVLAPVPDVTLRELTEYSRFGVYPRREDIDWQGDGNEGVVLGVVEGATQVSFLSLDGRELPVVVVNTGHLLELDAEGWAGVDATLVTVTSSSASCCLIAHLVFEQVVTSYQAAAILLLREERGWRQELGGLVSDRLYHSPEARIRRTLWRATRGVPDQSAIFTHEYLGARAGTTQPRATQEVGRLSRDGTIEVHRKEHRIIVVHPERLIDD